jgi:hypothetical protein
MQENQIYIKYSHKSYSKQVFILDRKNFSSTTRDDVVTAADDRGKFLRFFSFVKK